MTRIDGILFLFTSPDKASPPLTTHSLYLSILPTPDKDNLAYRPDKKRQEMMMARTHFHA
tara:strand:- start:521 stop:700 length:180 start_codon:yes stop_codon:yes gene_type:complete